MAKAAPTPSGKIPEQKVFYCFGPFRLDPEAPALFRDREPLHLTPKALALLVMLVKNHGSLVRKDKIILEIWPDTNVQDGSLSVQIAAIRQVLEADYIENVPKRGYQFTEKVTEEIEDPNEGASSTIKNKPLLWLSVIAVLLIAATVVFYVTAHYKAHTVAQESRPAVVLYNGALEYERQGDDEQAIATLDQAIAADPNYDDAYLRAAYLAYELGNMRKASDYLARHKTTEAKDEAIRLKAQALAQLLADNYIRAAELYQLLIDRYPEDADAQYRFAEVATNRDRLEEANKAIEACLKIDSQNPFCNFQLMYIRIKQNRFNDVLAIYKSLPANISSYSWFDEAVGVAFWGNGQLDQAGQAFERLSKKQRELHGTSHFTAGKEWMADILLYQGRVKEGTRRLQEIIETEDNASSRSAELVYLAKIHALLGDMEEGKKFASEAVANPGEAGDLTDAALVFAVMGDDGAVERALKLRLQMTTASLSPANDHLIHGLLAVAKGNVSNGIEEIRLTQELNPHDEEAAYWLGIAYFRAGDYKSALTMFQSVRELKGNILLEDVPLLMPLSTYHIAECYEKLQDPISAQPFQEEFAKIWAAADVKLKPMDSTYYHNSK